MTVKNGFYGLNILDALSAFSLSWVVTGCLGGEFVDFFALSNTNSSLSSCFAFSCCPSAYHTTDKKKNILRLNNNTKNDPEILLESVL